ncbi:MAG: phospholipase D-like domain-containing protein [Ktedonobacteraceae bacterium]
MYTPYKTALISLTYLVAAALCILLAGCDINISGPGIGTGSSGSGCQDNCTTGAGVQGVQVFVEPDAGEHPITDAITSAKKSVWLEIYLLTDRNVIRALEEAANRGVDVRVMLEPHPFGGGGSPARTMDQLKAAGAKVEASSPSFALTHEKGIPIVQKVTLPSSPKEYPNTLQSECLLCSCFCSIYLLAF